MHPHACTHSNIHSRKRTVRQPAAPTTPLKRSTSESDFASRGWRCDDGDEHDSNSSIWVVADPCSTDFGQKYTNMKAIVETGMTCGDFCLVPRVVGGAGGAAGGGARCGDHKDVVLLQHVTSRASFKSDFYTQARPQIAALDAMIKLKTPASADKRTDERREELCHWDIVATRPALKAHRVIIALLFFSVLAAVVCATYDDGNVSIFAPFLVTLLYPMGLFAVSRIMHGRQPAGRYIFELLLVFDVYHLVSALIMCVGVIIEASQLNMLFPPWGHTASITSPTLRLLIWWHYCNRIFELLDTIFRITQKKFQAYGALHFYLRLVSVWSWYAATCVGGGDVWFLLVWDSLVVSIRFLVFTLSLLNWNLNMHIDFGLHAPKVSVFRKEQLFRLQAFEFCLMLVHACYALVCGNMPRTLMVCQIMVCESIMCECGCVHIYIYIPTYAPT